jgi:hypothetical protein
MTNLTPQQIAEGWKPIAEIVKEPSDGVYQLLEPRPHSAYRLHRDVLDKADLVRYHKEYGGSLVFYRRLIPQTPDMVVISREDAENTLDMVDALEAESGLTQTQAHQKIIAKLEAALIDAARDLVFYARDSDAVDANMIANKYRKIAGGNNG